MTLDSQVQALIERRYRLNQEANEILTRSAGDLSAEDAERHERLFEEVDKLTADIERLERQEQRNRALAAPINQAIKPGGDDRQGDANVERRAAEQAAFRALIRGEAREIELRNLQVDNPSAGGYLFDTETFAYRLIKAMDDATFIRQMATIQRVPRGTSLGMPTLVADPADADWTGEVTAVTTDTTMAFGQRVLKPSPLAKQIKVSKTLLAATPNAASLVLDRLGYKFAITQEKAFLTGSGANQPLGVFTASNDGIPTSRDVATGSATDVTYAGLINTIFSVPEPYHRNASWVGSREFVKRVRRLVDGEQRPLYTSPLERGVPGNVLGYPVHMSEYVPATFADGLYVAVFGDFTHYLIGEALEFTVQRLVELYANTNQDAFLGRAEIDGQPVLAEAFARVKCATS